VKYDGVWRRCFEAAEKTGMIDAKAPLCLAAQASRGLSFFLVGVINDWTVYKARYTNLRFSDEPK
jgi:hypothetical protein